MKVYALLLTLITISAALPAVHVTGKKLFTSDGQQFYMIGIDYQPTTTADPIADVQGLNRDLPYLKDLGINTIRVYSSNADNNHDAGMKLLNDAGIYVLFDATEPEHSVNGDNPAWNTDIFSGLKKKILHFSKYTNVFGFLAGNEVILTGTQTHSAPYIKATVRDVKAYIKSINSTALVGYAATDVPANDDLQPFLDCDSEETSVDFYGINTYRWCNGATYETSGYAGFENTPYDRPIVFTEYGCNQPRPRQFDEVQAIYGRMTGTLSGGLVYQWTEEDNQYGLVKLDGYKITLLDDYNNLKSQFAKINPTRIQESAYVPPTSTVVPCPERSDKFQAQAFPLPPSPNEDSCKCLYTTFSCSVKPTASVAAIQSAVSTACGPQGVSCAAINSDYTTASYGQWSMCSSLQRASWALNAYYEAKRSSQGGSACDFGGVGQIVKPGQCNDPTIIVSSTVSKTISSSASVSASQTVTATKTVAETSLGSDGVTKTKSVSQSATLSASESKSASASQTATAVQTSRTLYKYQTDWDAAFSAATTTLPTIVLMVLSIALLLMN